MIFKVITICYGLKFLYLYTNYYCAAVVDNAGIPLNPFGRTGLSGRGNLGRWGPNHALDAIVSRWKRFPNGDFEIKNDKKVLEFIGVKRTDVEEWSLPGVSTDR